MLIDISDVLQINVFVLGGVFLQMCHLLRLEEHPMFSRYLCIQCPLSMLTVTNFIKPHSMGPITMQLVQLVFTSCLPLGSGSMILRSSCYEILF